MMLRWCLRQGAYLTAAALQMAMAAHQPPEVVQPWIQLTSLEVLAHKQCLIVLLLHEQAHALSAHCYGCRVIVHCSKPKNGACCRDCKLCLARPGSTSWSIRMLT